MANFAPSCAGTGAAAPSGQQSPHHSSHGPALSGAFAGRGACGDGSGVQIDARHAVGTLQAFPRADKPAVCARVARPSPEPYTLAQHAQRCQQSAQQGQTLVQFVQVRQYETTSCAVVTGQWVAPTGDALHALELLRPYAGRTCAPARRVTQCSGLDGGCLCAGEAGASAVGDMTC